MERSCRHRPTEEMEQGGGKVLHRGQAQDVRSHPWVLTALISPLT